MFVYRTVLLIMKFSRVISRVSPLRTRTEMVFETLVFLPFNHLTRLIVRENFFILSRRERNRCYSFA